MFSTVRRFADLRKSRVENKKRVSLTRLTLLMGMKKGKETPYTSEASLPLVVFFGIKRYF